MSSDRPGEARPCGHSHMVYRPKNKNNRCPNPCLYPSPEVSVTLEQPVLASGSLSAVLETGDRRTIYHPVTSFPPFPCFLRFSFFAPLAILFCYLHWRSAVHLGVFGPFESDIKSVGLAHFHLAYGSGYLLHLQGVTLFLIHPATLHRLFILFLLSPSAH